MTLKFAIAGAGFIANVHAQAILANNTEVVCVVEKFADKAEIFMAKFGIQKRFETVDELVKMGGVDALIIGTPNLLHAPQTIAALNAGMHVFVEKPMAMNAAEAQQMVTAAKRAGKALMVGHCWRFDPDVLWLKAQTGKIGKIIRTKGYGVHANWGPAGWFTQKALAGGGALADMGIHALDTARFLLGDPKPVSVYAHIGTYYKDFDVDDTGVIIVKWDNGTVSYIETGWWQPHSDGPEAGTQLYGTKGFGQLFPTLLELPNAEEQRMDVVKSGSIYPRPEHSPQSLYDAQMAHFIDCIHARKTPTPGGAEGLVNMRVVDAAYESARTGKVVEMES
jgi:predicted dehydrogenase